MDKIASLKKENTPAEVVKEDMKYLLGMPPDPGWYAVCNREGTREPKLMLIGEPAGDWSELEYFRLPE